MSSTNRGKKRHLDDFYSTPPQLADLICKELHHQVPNVNSIFEPGWKKMVVNQTTIRHLDNRHIQNKW